MRVFVYGSLKRGYWNHQRFLSKAVYVGRASTLPNYRLHDLGAYPAMSHGGGTVVQGEVFDVTLEQLADLDRLEGHPRYYRRGVVQVLVEAQGFTQRVQAWTYFMDGCTRPVIDSGVWAPEVERCAS